MSPNPDATPLSDDPDVIQPAEGEGIPGEVNIEWYKTALDALLPDRFHQVRPLHDKCAPEDECPVLVAFDKQTRADVMLQVFTTKEEYKRVSECALRCCKLKGGCFFGAPCSPGSPLSPSRKAPDELMICRITEVHADAEAEQWCVLMEPTINDKGPETLEALLRNGPLEKGKIRQAFIWAARAVQSLHHAGLVHNAICTQNMLRVKRGMKLGNYAALQRQGEERRTNGPGHNLCSPEKALAEDMDFPLKCDFATDVWCLGLLLHELVSGTAWDAGRPAREVLQELLAGEVVQLPALDVLGDSQEAEDVRSLISRMLTKHPMQRPVVDIVVQDAIAKLYVEHDLEPEASPPPSPMSPARKHCASPPAQRPGLGDSADSPVCSPHTGCEDEPRETWADGPATTGKFLNASNSSDPERPPPACQCRCSVM